MAGEEAGDVQPLSWTAYAGLGLGWFLALQVLSWTGLESEATRLMISGVAFVAFGLLCWKNGRDCGALHCRISGPGYLLLGGIAGVGALGWVPVELDWLMAAFVLIALGSYALEAGIGRREASRA